LDPTRYQRIRLWAGITSIGANLALIWALALTSGVWAARFPSLISSAMVLLAAAALVTLANLPFDMLTGDAVERAAGRTERATSSWLKDWSRGRSVTLLGCWAGMLFFLFIHQLPKSLLPWLMLAAGLFTLILFFLIPAGRPANNGSSKLKFEENFAFEMKTLGLKLRSVRWFDCGDLETVNGYITPRGFLSLSDSVAQWLTPREAALMAAREEYYRRSGAWILIHVIVAFWTLLGIALASITPCLNPVQAGLSGAAVMSSWCFLALFIWPTINRILMRKADIFLASLVAKEEVRSLLLKIESLNATDISLPAAKTAVFHPIPPLQERLNRLS
jgi:hypothetical protein